MRGNTKTIKNITIAKRKNEFLVDWLLNEVHWKEIAKKLNYSKASVFNIKKRIAKYREEFNKEENTSITADFYAISHIFTIAEVNALIDLYNYHVEHPEEYEKPKTKKQLRIEEQEKIAAKAMKEMNMTYDKQSEE